MSGEVGDLKGFLFDGISSLDACYSPLWHISQFCSNKHQLYVNEAHTDRRRNYIPSNNFGGHGRHPQCFKLFEVSELLTYFSCSYFIKPLKMAAVPTGIVR